MQLRKRLHTGAKSHAGAGTPAAPRRGRRYLSGMVKVVLPRYMKTTADGVKLGPKAWGNMLDAAPNAIKRRIYRLQTAAKDDNQKGPPVSKWEQDKRRAAHQTIREATPDKVVDLVEKALARPEVVEKIVASKTATKAVEKVATKAWNERSERASRAPVPRQS